MKRMFEIGLLVFFLLFQCNVALGNEYSSEGKSQFTLSVTNSTEHLENDDFQPLMMLYSPDVFTQMMTLSTTTFRGWKESQQEQMKDFIGQLSVRVESLSRDYIKEYPSILNFFHSPACHYFIFMLRRILI